MKKKSVCAIALVASLALLCGCRAKTPSLSLSANWHSHTMNKAIVATNERLVYTTDFTPSSQNGGYLGYDEGEYVVSLNNGVIDHNGSQTSVYILTSELTISGTFTYQNVSEKFTDHTRAEVIFLSVEEGLRPLSSTKEIESHVPLAAPSSEHLYMEAHYSYSISYDDNLESAKFTFTDLTADEPSPEESTVKLSGSGSYFDNEQIFFALRGLDLSSAVTFRSIDPQSRACTNLTFPDTPSETKRTCAFTIVDADGNTLREVNEEISTKEVRLAYRTAQPGPDRTLVYASRVNENDNTFRNVLLEIDNPVMHSLGTMTYRLKTAKFAD